MVVNSGFKQTEVGIIPQDWELRTFSQIGTLDKGKGLLKEDIKESGRIPAIPYTALYTDFSEVLSYKRIKWFVDDPAQTYVAQEPCVLIASSSNMAANTGKASALSGTTPVAIGREVIVFKTTSNPIFISYLLSTASYRKRTLALARGTTIKHVYPATFADYMVGLPRAVEQTAIAGALSDADALIESLEQLLAKKRQIKQGATQELLTGKRRLPGFTGEWEPAVLGDLATFHKGIGLPKSTIDVFGDEECIHYGELFTKYGETIREVISRTARPAKCIRSAANDVVMPTSDVTPRGLAKASCVESRGVILGGDILVIRCRPDQVCGSFLSYVIRHEEEQVLQLVRGSTVFHLYGTDMRKFTFLMPEFDEQKAIVAILSDIDAELAAIESRLTKARRLKHGMMQELLTGRVRLV